MGCLVSSPWLVSRSLGLESQASRLHSMQQRPDIMSSFWTEPTASEAEELHSQSTAFPLDTALIFSTVKARLAHVAKKVSRLKMALAAPRLDRLFVTGVGPLRPRNDVKQAAQLRRELKHHQPRIRGREGGEPPWRVWGTSRPLIFAVERVDIVQTLCSGSERAGPASSAGWRRLWTK